MAKRTGPKHQHYLISAEHIEDIEGHVVETFTRIESLQESFAKHETPKPSAEAHDNDDGFWPEDDEWMSYYRPYRVKNGVLEIPVYGVLINKFPYQLGSWATGYEYIERAMMRGQEDPEVTSIALRIDSPGGLVDGCFECSDKLFEFRGKKPVTAYADSHAYSAAYALASAADEIVVTRTGGVGSVGVVTMHVDFSKAVEEDGIKVTYIYAGKHKVEGNPFEKLSGAAKDRIQGRINKLYGMFVDTVARNREMSVDDVKATEALTYIADEAIEVGFADRIGYFTADLNQNASEIGSGDNAEEDTMSKENSQNPDEAKVTAADVESARTEGRTEGATAERQRYAAVMGSEHYEGREELATEMLGDTDLSAEKIVSLLAKSPKEQAAAPAEPDEPAAGTKDSAFTAAMDKGGTPGIESAERKDEDQSDDAKAAADLVSAGRAVGAISTKKKASA